MKLTKILLIAIVILASLLRFYKLAEIPPSISWDETAVGYNAYTIANFARDEYGKFLPLFFRSFGDDKHPIHVYLTSFSVKILGLSEFSTRLPSAIFGTFNVLLTFFLGTLLFKSDLVGLSAAFFLAISPYNIHFSRFNHEANFVSFFFMLGLLLFYLSLKKNTILLPLSILAFGITFITYHPAKIVVPIIGLVLTILYIKEVNKDKNFLAAILILMLFLTLLIFNPELLGLSRVNQTAQGAADIEKTKLYQLTHNNLLGRANLILIQYSWHFFPQYLFTQGDKNARLSSQIGEFYKIDAIFLILGVVYLIYKRSKESLVLLTWALVAPLPSALVAEAPHAARASLMMGSWHLISALGFYYLVTIFRKPIFKWVIGAISLIVLALSLSSYLTYYYNEYAKRYAIDWQYGMKQIVEFVKTHTEYDQVYMTDIRSQPYIFFLYYLKTPLPEYLNTVLYNNSESKSYNNVSYFGKFYFGGWDPIESLPNKGVLYVISPSQYDGLRHKSFFDVKKLIYYPNGTTAFFIISTK